MARRVAMVVVLLAAGALAGCDKCGNWVTPNLPSIPKSCTGDK